MEDVEMAENGGRPLSIRERKKATMTPKDFEKWRKNRNNRNKNHNQRREKDKEINNLKSIDNGLHGRIQQLEKEKEEVHCKIW